MIKVVLGVVAASIGSSAVAAVQAEPICTKEQALPLDRRPTQSDLSASGIDMDARAVTLFVKFAPSAEPTNGGSKAMKEVNCQLPLGGTGNTGLPHDIYITPDRYINIRRGLAGDSIANWGFGGSSLMVHVRFGHVTALNYRQISANSGLVSFFVQANNKSGYFVQYRLP